MAKTRAKPANWAVNEKLTSAQMNLVDQNAAECLDKTSAGDDLSGIIAVGDGGAMSLDHANAYIRAAAAGAKIEAAVAGGLVTSVAGGLELDGGANDWPVLVTPRTRYFTKMLLELKLDLGADWAVSASLVGLIAQRTGNTGADRTATFALPVHNGATLTEISIAFSSSADWGVVPSDFPRCYVTRRRVIGATPLQNSLLSAVSGYVSYPSELLAAWNSNAPTGYKTFTVTPDQNNVIDESFAYYLTLYSASAASGSGTTRWYDVSLKYEDIEDMRFA